MPHRVPKCQSKEVLNEDCESTAQFRMNSLTTIHSHKTNSRVKVHVKLCGDCLRRVLGYDPNNPPNHWERIHAPSNT